LHVFHPEYAPHKITERLSNYLAKLSNLYDKDFSIELILWQTTTRLALRPLVLHTPQAPYVIASDVADYLVVYRYPALPTPEFCIDPQAIFRRFGRPLDWATREKYRCHPLARRQCVLGEVINKSESI
jgi:hypothetical protein